MSNLFLSKVELDSKCFFYLSNVLITKNNIFLITHELAKKAQKIKNENGNIKLLDKKNKEYDFPIEIETVLKNYKNIKKILNKDFKIIVPFSFKDFENIENVNGKNITFCNSTKLVNYIEEKEKDNIEETNNIEEIRRKIAAINYQKKFKIPFLNWNVKDTVWEKHK